MDESSPSLRQEIEACLYNYEVPNRLNPHDLKLEDLLLEIIDREKRKAVDDVFAGLLSFTKGELHEWLRFQRDRMTGDTCNPHPDPDA